MEPISRIYRRAFSLIRQWPLLLLAPVLAEFAQHIAEIQAGMYSGGMEASGRSVRLGFGIVKIATVLCTMIVAWRLWHNEGDLARAVRPSVRLLQGIGKFVVVQILGDAVALGIGRGLIALAGDPVPSVRIAFALVPLLLWLLVSAALFPRYVALATEDRAMTLRRTLTASRGQLPAVWALLFAGVLPLMALHYALGYAALRGAPAWPLMATDAFVVGALTACLAATYYTLYQRALARSDYATAS